MKYPVYKYMKLMMDGIPIKFWVQTISVGYQELEQLW